MVGTRTRVALHARNDVYFPERDYELVRRARIETLKMMSFTDPSVFGRLRRENPDIEFIVRLYDERFNPNSRPTPAAFVNRIVPFINRLRPYATKFEIHNEPNHAMRIEGWGPSDDNARAFRSWYLQVLTLLRKAAPWARFGFPGLALNHPHRDLEWLNICRDAINASDWLGCHCYWQYDNMLNNQWGLRFKLYHDRFPNKRIEITEFGNSTPNLPASNMADQYARYYRELMRYSYLGSASAFIASSPDPAWAPFVWAKESGEMLPVVRAIGDMERPPLTQTQDEPMERLFPETGKTVRGVFLEFFDSYGLNICGYPITQQFKEDGLQSQYFQRIGVEQLKSGKLRLKPVGTEAWASRPRIASLAARVEELLQLAQSPGIGRPAIADLVDQLLKHADKRYANRAHDRIRRIVVHHTATVSTITPQRLAEYQVRTLGKPGIIYHFVVAADGKIYQTNRLATVSDHAGSYSADSVAVVFPGNFTAQVPAEAQLAAGAQLLAWLLPALRLTPGAIVGMSELIDTQSPGKQWLSGQKWKQMLLDRIGEVLEAAGEDQFALIGSLRERIEALEAEIAHLKDKGAASPRAPLGLLRGAQPVPAPVGKPEIQDLIDRLPKHATNRYKTRALDTIDTLVIHHSAVAPSVGPQRIAEYHVKKHDWPGIGYHFLVGADGTISQGNHLETISYHAVQANPDSVGICFLGNFMNDVPPPAQLRAGAHLLAWLMGELSLTTDDIKGHRDVVTTKCPGAQWIEGQNWRQMLRREVAAVQAEAAAAASEPEPEPEPDDGKSLYHYLLFWSQDGKWAERDWINAAGYVGAFHPSAGVSARDASQAEYVTIIGSALGVSKEIEQWLRSAGSKVERIAGKDEADTKRMLDDLVRRRRRFQTFEE